MGQGEDDSQRFLRQARLDEIGELIAPLIGGGLGWVERRKESVQILDDRALRRQISVDFSLRSTVDPLLDGKEKNDPLYCAPIFVLPKSPSNLRSFDLRDEEGHALMLISRADNAKISGAALVSLVGEHADLPEGQELPAELKAELRRSRPRMPSAPNRSRSGWSTTRALGRTSSTRSGGTSASRAGC